MTKNSQIVSQIYTMYFKISRQKYGRISMNISTVYARLMSRAVLLDILHKRLQEPLEIDSTCTMVSSSRRQSNDANSASSAALETDSSILAD